MLVGFSKVQWTNCRVTTGSGASGIGPFTIRSEWLAVVVPGTYVPYFEEAVDMYESHHK
jgi:hypothetical protein